MADVLAWVLAHWGYVATFITGGGVGALFKGWLDLRSDSREQAKTDREGDLHPLEKKKREQELALGDVALRKAMLELEQLLAASADDDKDFYRDLVHVTVQLSLALLDKADKQADDSTLELFYILKKLRNWSKADVRRLYQPQGQPASSEEAADRLLLANLNVVRAHSQLHGNYATLVAVWVASAISTRRSDGSKSLEEIYQVFRSRPKMAARIPQSVHIMLAEHDAWLERGAGEKRVIPQSVKVETSFWEEHAEDDLSSANK